MVLRLREFFSRPAAYGALAISYVGIIAAVAFAATAAVNNAASDRRAEARADQRIAAAARRADQRIAAVVNENHRAFCSVNIREHEAALRAVEDQKLRLAQTLDYLRDPYGDRALQLRVRLNLPNVRRDVRQARQAARATRPPDLCKTYQKEK